MNNNQIDELKVSVSNLVQGDVRNQAVIELAAKFDINLSPIKEFVQQKRVVLRQLLKHILREEENEAEIEKFSNLLYETKSWLLLSKKTGWLGWLSPWNITKNIEKQVTYYDYIFWLSSIIAHSIQVFLMEQYLTRKDKSKDKEIIKKLADINQKVLTDY